MISFSDYVSSRLPALGLTQPSTPKLADVARALRVASLHPGSLLDDGPDVYGGRGLDLVIHHRLRALIRLSGWSASALAIELFGHDTPLRASPPRSGAITLTLLQVDQVLARLELPPGRLLSPVLGPYDLPLLRQIKATPSLARSLARATKADRTAAQLVVDRKDAVSFLARLRGEYVPSRPKGPKGISRPGGGGAAGGMLNRAGCNGAVQSLVDQALIRPGPPLTLTAAGLALVTVPDPT